MKTQIRSPLLNKQNNGIFGNTRKTKGHKERLGLGTLTLNQGISSQGSGAAVRIDGPRGGVNWAFFKFLKQNKATLTYAMLVRLNSPTGYLSNLHKL